jgi:hypothetical protein
MKLQQGQIWKTVDEYLRIVHLERLEVQYKSMKDLATREGSHHHVSKKDFCRLIKNAAIVPEVIANEETAEVTPPRRPDEIPLP